MRGYVILLGAVLTVGGCAGPGPDAPPASSTPTAAGPVVIDPDAVARVRSELPPGYEVGALGEHAAPASFWGVKPDWTAAPPQCAVLADPGPGTPVRGWSASGPGGIVYAMVAGPGAPAVLPEGCEQWALTGGRTAAAVRAVPPPVIDDTPTVAMNTVATTVVEGAAETRSHADTVSAYLDSGYVASVTVVTDPGSALPALGPDVAARLLAQTVTAIRGAGR